MVEIGFNSIFIKLVRVQKSGIIGFYLKPKDPSYERCHSGELQIYFEDLGFLKKHLHLTTWVLLHFIPIKIQSPWLGIKPATTCSAVDRHSQRHSQSCGK